MRKKLENECGVFSVDTPRGFCEKYEWDKEQYGYIRSILVNNVKIGEIIFE